MNIAVIITLAVLGLFALIGGIRGFKQGTPRQVIHVVLLAASATLSVIIARMLLDKLLLTFEAMTPQQLHDFIIGLPLIPQGMNLDWITSLDIATVKTILIVPVMLVVIPTLFVLLFILLSTIMKIIHFIFCGLFGLSKRNKGALSSFVGFIIGMAEGIIVAAIILLPAFGLVNAAKESVARVNEEMPEESGAAELTALYNAYLAPVADNPVFTTVGNCGLNQVFDILVTFEDEGVSINTADLLPDVAMIYATKGSFAEFSWQSLTPENKNGIEKVTEIIEANPFFTKFCASAIYSVANAYCDGAIPLPIPEPYNSVVDEAMHIFLTTDETNVHADADTIIAVYYILSDSGSLKAYMEGADQMLAALTKKDDDGSTSINRIIDEIKNNERTKPLITLITKVSISVMQKNLGLSTENAEIYENVKAGLTETLKIDRADYPEGEEGEAAYRAEVSSSIDTTLKDNGITLEPEVVDKMSDYVAENMSDIDDITDDELNDLILSYYDAYLEHKSTDTTP